MPRTTLDIDATVLAELKRRSRRERKTAGRLASELLAHALAAGTERSAEPLEWTANDLGRTLIDIDDKDALYQALDSE